MKYLLNVRTRLTINVCKWCNFDMACSRLTRFIYIHRLTTTTTTIWHTVQYKRFKAIHVDFVCKIPNTIYIFQFNLQIANHILTVYLFLFHQFQLEKKTNFSH